jgi:acetyl-CoA carboxylase carboxyltransferase component
VAWPDAEIAVLGAAPAAAILDRRGLNPSLEDQYRIEFENPYRAAERGVVDAVVEPTATRRILCDALDVLVDKRDLLRARRHSNTPL